MVRHKDCLLCYSNARRRSNYPGHVGYRRQAKKEVWELVALFRRSVVRGGDGLEVDLRDDALYRTAPELHDFLLVGHWPDGSVRDRGTVLVFSDGGSIKACLNDKDAGAVCFVTADTFQGVLKAANAALGEGKGDWRPVKAPPARKSR